MGYVKTTADVDEKKCPFLYDKTHIVSDCLKGNCHLWLEEIGQCSIPVLARQALGQKQGEKSELAFAAVSRQ